MKISRTWAMPSADTFSIKPIGAFVWRYLADWHLPVGEHVVSVDPFARNSRQATYTNDLDPQTAADQHMDAEEFLRSLHSQGIVADVVLFDPPYSPRQISECYRGIGREVTAKDTQNSVLYSRVRSAIPPLLKPGGIVLSFGWSSTGMGKKHGFEIEEILLVCHGGARNDTICLAERRM